MEWLVTFTQTLATSAPSETNPAAVTSVWDFILKGGYMMIPIGICSLIALGIFIERVISLRRANVIPPAFLPGLKKVLREHPDDAIAAYRYCRKNPSPVANVFAAGVRRLSQPVEKIERQIHDAGQREVLKLRRFRRVLSVIATITPLFGLLGTILGMITAFQTVALTAEALGKTELLAKGIYEAMITTAAGLSVAIPVMIGYHLISGRIEKLVLEIDRMTVDFIIEFVEQDAVVPADVEDDEESLVDAVSHDANGRRVGADVGIAPT